MMILLFQDAAVAEGESFSLLDLILQGGILGMAIIAILLLLSIIGLYIFIERMLTISKAAKVDQSFMTKIRSNVKSGAIETARGLCQSTETPIANMIEKGLLRIGRPLGDIQTAVENVGNLEVSRLENRLSTLATIAGAAPMIGFFGTVTGMIMAFYEMATQENVTPDVLAGGIYQALLTTAFGLFIGILAYVGYNYLVSRVNKVIFNMEATSLEFLDLLQEPAH